MHDHLDTLRGDILRGRLSRRFVLKRSMALGLSAPVIAGLLAACGEEDDEPTAVLTVADTSQADPTPIAAESEAVPEAEATPTTTEIETEAETELDPERQAEIFIRMNDLVVENVAQIPLVQRLGVSAHAADLEGISPSRWTSELYNVADWRRAT